MANETNVNFGERNIRSVDKHIREDKFAEKAYRMLVDESGHEQVKISKESRRIYAKNLVR